MSRTLGIGGALILAAGVFFPLFTFRLREQSNNPGHFGANPVALDPGREALRLQNMPRISDLLPFKRVVSPYNPEPPTHTVSSWAWGSVGMILLSAAAVTLVLACVGSWKDVLAIGCGIIVFLSCNFFAAEAQTSQFNAIATDPEERGWPFGTTVTWDWGWLVLFLGSALVLVAGIAGVRRGLPGDTEGK
jgi:hypothetical protein